MTNNDDDESGDHRACDTTLVQQYAIDASTDKVWRAISIPSLRQHWLPDRDLESSEPQQVVPGREIRYAMRDPQAPYLRSEVVLSIAPAAGGKGTVLTIVHVVAQPGDAANDDNAVVMRAA